jgi:hypothetical protein
VRSEKDYFICRIKLTFLQTFISRFLRDKGTYFEFMYQEVQGNESQIMGAWVLTNLLALTIFSGFLIGILITQK